MMRKDVADHFWAGVSIGDNDTCWPWQRRIHRSGYGRLSVGRRCLLAHRFAWELTHGPIAQGMVVCHSCDNPPCCNPNHLWIGTPADNNHDRKLKGRNAAPGNCTFSRWPNLVRGENNNNAKLTQKTADEIRSLYKKGEVRQKDIAAMYGLNQSTVGRIVSGQLWWTPESSPSGRHVPGEQKGKAAGQRNGSAKLTSGDVREIRSQFAEGGTTISRLSRTYGVSWTAIQYVVLRKTWNSDSAMEAS